MIDIPGTIEKTDLLSLAEQAGARFRKTGNSWRSHCPLHKGDNRSGFEVYNGPDGKARWKCHTGPCGGGDVLDFVKAWQGFSKLSDAYKFLGGDMRPDPETVAQHAADQAARAIAEMEAQIAKAQAVLDELRQAHTWLLYHQNMTSNPGARALWRNRGIADGWQDFWKLGYCESFTVGTENGRWTTPTLTIPVFGPAQGEDWPLMNVRHRLINPPKPNDKYRPDRPGLVNAPFIANPYLGWDTDPILVIEGEIKTMVTFQTIYKDGETMQVIGIPGKSQFRSIVNQLRGHDVYICLDPDAEEQATEAARLVGGRVLSIPTKIDDAILAGNLNQTSLRMRMKGARKA